MTKILTLINKHEQKYKDPLYFGTESFSFDEFNDSLKNLNES